LQNNLGCTHKSFDRFSKGHEWLQELLVLNHLSIPIEHSLHFFVKIRLRNKMWLKIGKLQFVVASSCWKFRGGLQTSINQSKFIF